MPDRIFKSSPTHQSYSYKHAFQFVFSDFNAPNLTLTFSSLFHVSAINLFVLIFQKLYALSTYYGQKFFRKQVYTADFIREWLVMEQVWSLADQKTKLRLNLKKIPKKVIFFHNFEYIFLRFLYTIVHHI